MSGWLRAGRWQQGRSCSLLTVERVRVQHQFLRAVSAPPQTDSLVERDDLVPVGRECSGECVCVGG